jgi:predicted DNA-binding transcriptional regulator YafY
MIAQSKARKPKDFDLDTYLASGALGFRSINAQDVHPVEIELRFHPQAGQSLLECRLSEDQQVTFEEDHSIHIRATVPMTAQLVWWLRGFGQGVEVLSPRSLKDALTQHDFEQS